MSATRKQVSSVLKKLAKAVHDLSDADFDALMDEATSIGLVLRREPDATSETKRRSPQLLEAEVIEVIAALDQLQTREEGERFLAERCPSRVALEQVARASDLPVTKRDSSAKLASAIVEATIGFRLRSRAIQEQRDPS